MVPRELLGGLHPGSLGDGVVGVPVKPLAGVAWWATAGEPSAGPCRAVRFGMATVPLMGLGQLEWSDGVGWLEGPCVLSQVAQWIRDVIE